MGINLTVVLFCAEVDICAGSNVQVTHFMEISYTCTGIIILPHDYNNILKAGFKGLHVS
jgi:hypothetical protein